MSTVIAVALGLAPIGDSGRVSGDYSKQVGRYSQSIDRHGKTHLSGVERESGARFDLVIDREGRVEGTVGPRYVSFRVQDAN